MVNNNIPYLMTKKQAADFLGIDPKSFDKYFKSKSALNRFMIGSQERYTKNELIDFIKKNYV